MTEKYSNINDSQINRLKSLKIIRFSELEDSIENRRKLAAFSNGRNQALDEYLYGYHRRASIDIEDESLPCIQESKAWEEDQNGRINLFIVLTEN